MSLSRIYRAVRLPGKDRPFRHPGRLIHAQEEREDGSLFYERMTVCGRIPREEHEQFVQVAGNSRITCPSCKGRMR